MSTRLQPPQQQGRQPGREAEMRPRPKPLIPASLSAGQPNEIAPCYVFLASDEASYISGQILHPNGGTVVGS